MLIENENMLSRKLYKYFVEDLTAVRQCVKEFIFYFNGLRPAEIIAQREIIKNYLVTPEIIFLLNRFSGEALTTILRSVNNFMPTITASFSIVQKW